MKLVPGDLLTLWDASVNVSLLDLDRDAGPIHEALLTHAGVGGSSPSSALALFRLPMMRCEKWDLFIYLGRIDYFDLFYHPSGRIAVWHEEKVMGHLKHAG